MHHQGQTGDPPSEGDDRDGSYPAGYLITVRTYGTWLPGDPRGWTGQRPGSTTKQWKPSPALEADARRRLHGAPLILSDAQRRIVDAAVRDVCRHRGWQLHAVNVRTNHAHVVVTGLAKPERILADLKSWSTRRLREASEVAADERVWAGHGSTRYLWDLRDLEVACRYVEEAQDAPGGDDPLE
jgi:REP element-mobilizing transposase RayT